MQYTSIQRNIRGFNYQSDFAKPEDFAVEMMDQQAKDNEVCWAFLFDVQTGEIVMKYRRGYVLNTPNNETGGTG